LDTAITTKAKAMGYNLVFRKDALLFGGTDITNEILPLVK
jgi:Skp family chaperone for outer membrane proteins